MPNPRDQDGAAPAEGSPHESPLPESALRAEKRAASSFHLPPFPSSPKLSASPPDSGGSLNPAPSLPDFSIPPFDPLPPFPSLSPDEPADEPPAPFSDTEPLAGFSPPSSPPDPVPELAHLPPFVSTPSGFPSEASTTEEEEQAPAARPLENAGSGATGFSPPAFPSHFLPTDEPLPAPAPAPRRRSRKLRRKLVRLLRLAAVFLAFVAVLAVASWAVKLPDVVTARVTVTGLKSSAPVIPPRDGSLAELYVEEKQSVAQDQIVALIESGANANLVFRIASEIKKLQPFLGDESAFTEIDVNTEKTLGPLADTYNAFHSDYLRYRSLLLDDYTENSIASLQKQLEGKREKIGIVGGQADDAKREVELAERKYERMKSLFERRTISVAELQEQERALLVQRRLAAGVAEKIVEDRITLPEFENDIRDLRRRRDEDLRASRDALRGSVRRLAEGIDAWDKAFVLRAPEDGIIVFYDYWREQRRVREGREAFLVIPESSPLIGRIRVEKERAGKIQDGQEVQIRLDGFPHREYGVVPGTVESISAVPLNDAYLVSVKLEYPLVTSEGRSLTFKQEMAGDACIFTNEVRLLYRAARAAWRLTSRAESGQGS